MLDRQPANDIQLSQSLDIDAMIPATAMHDWPLDDQNVFTAAQRHFSTRTLVHTPSRGEVNGPLARVFPT